MTPSKKFVTGDILVSKVYVVKFVVLQESLLHYFTIKTMYWCFIKWKIFYLSWKKTGKGFKVELSKIR